MIHVYDCGPDHTCYTCDDVEIGSCAKDQDAPPPPPGTFSCPVTPPLQPGQVVYARDDFFDPTAEGIGNGPACALPVIVSPVVVPLLERPAETVLVGLLGVLGLAALLRLRRTP